MRFRRPWPFSRHRRAGKPHRNVRLFWVVLRSFILVIVLSIGGMLLFFGLVFGRRDHDEDDFSDRYWKMRQEYADAFATYYAAQDHSWEGIHHHLRDMSRDKPERFPVVAIIDNHRRVVASTIRNLHIGEEFDNDDLRDVVPVWVDGRQVGGVLLWGPDLRPGGPEGLFVLIGAGGTLAGILITLAIFFVRRFSNPLQHLRDAAQTLATGQMDVQVPGTRIKELNDLAEAFNTMARALAEADQQRRQMTADIAHELRTPLSIIKGRLEGVQDGIYEATPEQIERLLCETALLERLIEDLRLLALAEAGQLPLYLEVIAPADLLEETADAFAEQAAAQEVALCLDVADNLPPVYVDPQRMAQVLANLVTNALRHTSAGRSVVLQGQRGAADSSNQVLLTVRDTGKGIAPEDLPHIFDRFWRADRARTRAGGSSGLGLAIARQIVAAHGGTIQAASTVGVGTAMTIILPQHSHHEHDLPRVPEHSATATQLLPGSGGS